MSIAKTAAPTPAVVNVRQVVVHLLLFILLMLFATGLANLFTSSFKGFAVERNAPAQLPLALAFTLVAGPLAWLLWRRIAPSLVREAGSTSAAWGLQAAAVYVVALVVGGNSLLALLGTLAAGYTTSWSDNLGMGLAWGLLFAWQYRVLRNPRYSPSRLHGLAWVLGNYYTLAVATFALVALLRSSLKAILPTDQLIPLLDGGSWREFANLLVWVVGAAVLWGWHWYRLGVRSMDTGLATVILLVSIGFAAAAALLGLAFALGAALPIPVDPASIWERVVDQLPLSGALALAGFMVWIYHAAVLRQHASTPSEFGRQVISGIALSIGATGFGMVIHAMLSAFSPSLVGNDPQDVLRVGLALFTCGAVSWVMFWRPLSPAAAAARRIYLVLFFGVSAVVALVALLVVGYRVFRFLITPELAGPSLIGETSAALGLLIATAVVATYHFVLWRSDRAEMEPVTAQAEPAVDTVTSLNSVTVVADAQWWRALQLPEEVAQNWKFAARTDQRGTGPTDPAALLSALSALGPSVEHALVLVEDGTVHVVPIQSSLS
ncbi:DUF5671 domain-containing protein [Specibacter sp. RAF43]|uniref:DUF5671 domain-containing protein n=1 Tax=Specibacter sp. RAF43 TaxID=3233057 RepID=UPI003F988540